VVLGHRFRGRVPAGILLTAAVAIALSVGFSLTAIASLGSAVALIVFALVSVGHLRARDETGANTGLLRLAVGSAVTVLATFAFTTLIEEPGTAVALVAILLLSVALDLGWKHRRPDDRPGLTPGTPDGPVPAPHGPAG
jgi:amino acid transporter